MRSSESFGWITFVPEGSRQSVSDFQQQLINGNSAFTEYFENLIHTAYGDRLLPGHNALMHDADGNCTGIVGSGEDIHRPQADGGTAALGKRTARDHGLLSVGDGVISTDVEGG